MNEILDLMVELLLFISAAFAVILFAQQSVFLLKVANSLHHIVVVKN
jgi:hypothetical protein